GGRFVNGERVADRISSRGFGAKMSGVIGVMRRTLLSCTSLVPGGIAGAGAVSLIDTSPAWAAEPALNERLIQAFMNLSRHDLTAQAMALGALNFSVAAGILLLRTRIRAAANAQRLRLELRELQSEEHRF